LIDLVKFSMDHVGIPYKNEPPYSIEQGFNCLEWAKTLYSLSDKNVQHSLDNLKLYTKQFRKLQSEEEPILLDIALFYVELVGERHIGVMLNNKTMSHCTKATNGVALSNITRQPWVREFKGFYRFNEDFCS